MLAKMKTLFMIKICNFKGRIANTFQFQGMY